MGFLAGSFACLLILPVPLSEPSAPTFTYRNQNEPTLPDTQLPYVGHKVLHVQCHTGARC